MEGQARIVIAAGRQQRVHDFGMNGRLSVRGDDCFDRDSSYLMAESKIISILDQQTMADQLVDDQRVIDY
jgi:hypothetical protein